MSYDLYLKPRQAALSREEFEAYFRDRRHYETSAGQANYFNDDTGVYFNFAWTDSATHVEEDGEFHPAYFNLNYFRPSYFILEAEGEVSAFVKAFDLVVHDPQMHGMGKGEYDVALLHSGWNAGNQSAYDMLLEMPEQRSGVFTLPTAIVRQAWRWNYELEVRRESAGPTRFAPRIVLLEVEGQAGTAMVWADGIPLVAIPVDWLILAGDKLFQHRPDFAGTKRLMPWAEAMQVVAPFVKQSPDLVVTFDYDEAPPKCSTSCSSFRRSCAHCMVCRRRGCSIVRWSSALSQHCRTSRTDIALSQRRHNQGQAGKRQ
ncbi:MAG: hypothetical protein Q8L22_24245 [Reyranella sp.]|nr:hypothetical protein [Reyranella sp.]